VTADATAALFELKRKADLDSRLGDALRASGINAADALAVQALYATAGQSGSHRIVAALRAVEGWLRDGGAALPKTQQSIEDQNRELVRENEVLRSNCDHLSSENASLSSQVDSMAMRIESLADELAKPEDMRLREVIDALDGRAAIFDGLGTRVGHLLDEMDEWIERAGAAERRLKKADEVVKLARQLMAYSWEDRLEDCKVSDDVKHDSRELSIAIWLYDQEHKP
jgi:hypothetical protein